VMSASNADINVLWPPNCPNFGDECLLTMLMSLAKAPCALPIYKKLILHAILHFFRHHDQSSSGSCDGVERPEPAPLRNRAAGRLDQLNWACKIYILMTSPQRPPHPDFGGEARGER
jgi:hypothetical protein